MPSLPGPESGFAGSQGRIAVSPCASGICVDVDTEARNSTAGLGSVAGVQKIRRKQYIVGLPS